MSTLILRALAGFAGGLCVTIGLLAPRDANAYWFQLHHGACMVPGSPHRAGDYVNGPSLTLLCPVPNYSDLQLTRIDDVVVHGYDVNSMSEIQIVAGVTYENSNGGAESGAYGDTDDLADEYAISLGTWFWGRGNANFGYVRIYLPYSDTRFRGIYFHRP